MLMMIDDLGISEVFSGLFLVE